MNIAAAGATFPLPFYNLAFKTYQEKTGNAVTYGGIGSGGGIRSLKDKIVDFGGSDAYLSDAEMQEMPYATVHIPTCMGAVVMAYNLPEVKELKLSGEVVADIYLGKITKWNDAKIQELNPSVTLPNKELTPVYRSDGSGTTFVFSDYLTKVSNDWKENVGTGKSLKWPAGLAAKGNPGVAGTISQTPGAIGYVGSEYAFSLNIPMAQMKNSSGNFITPNTESISAAAKGRNASRYPYHDHELFRTGRLPHQLFHLDYPLQGTSLCKQNPSTSTGNREITRLDVKPGSTSIDYKSSLLTPSSISRG